MIHEILGTHKSSSSEWFTPPTIWAKVRNTLGQDVYDPCPPSGEHGLALSWLQHPFIYINPPAPASPWAIKAIKTHQENPETNIVFAAFSEAVMWQVNELMNYQVCWVHNPISWIDGNPLVKAKDIDYEKYTDDYYKYIDNQKYADDHYQYIDNQWYQPNPGYLKPTKSPRNYNCMICISKSSEVNQRFADSFKDLGQIRVSTKIKKMSNDNLITVKGYAISKGFALDIIGIRRLGQETFNLFQSKYGIDKKPPTISRKGFKSKGYDPYADLDILEEALEIVNKKLKSLMTKGN